MLKNAFLQSLLDLVPECNEKSNVKALLLIIDNMDCDVYVDDPEYLWEDVRNVLNATEGKSLHNATQCTDTNRT